MLRVFMNGLRILFAPDRVWSEVHDRNDSVMTLLLGHTIPFALLPTIAWYLGVTATGWTFAGETYRLTGDSALALCVLFNLAMVGGVLFLAFMVTWMSPSYGGSAELARGVRLITYTASPFFVAGLIGLYPVLWLDILVGTAVACYCIYLLYRGTSVIMDVGWDRSFLYASSVLAVALVAFVALLGATVVMWEFGPAPEYTL